MAGDTPNRGEPKGKRASSQSCASKLSGERTVVNRALWRYLCWRWPKR